ncbi:MAG: hypothetical protein RL685_1142 [Pseudomonadota bacterium]|jgi:hypothetical protein
MNLQLLIDSIVRQTTVLIAQLATAQGVRAPLAHVANQVFLDLAQELSRQGVSRKVSADMFGLALRTYLRKIQRLEEGATDRGHSLWEAVLGHLQKSSPAVVLRAEVLRRFHRDEPELVRGVLHDLCESGVVFRIGSGDGMGYRAATQDELGILSGAASEGDELLWAIIYREGPLDVAALQRLVPGPGLEASLTRLRESGRVSCQPSAEGEQLSATHFFVARDAASGWEAAVFDHFQALVRTIAARLHAGPSERETVGGSTYSFDVWPGHPLEAEALAQLQRFRTQSSDLRQRIADYNRDHPHPRVYSAITIYAGQCVQEEATDVEERDAT